MNKVIKVISKISIFSFVGIGFNIVLIYIFLSLWIRPQVDDIEMIQNLSLLMIFEFVMVHSGVFMSVLGRSWKGWIGFTLFYGLFAFVFNLMVSGNQILILYAAVVLNRMLPNILNKDKTDKMKKIMMSSLYAFIYFVLLIIVVLAASHIPRFGLTEKFLTAANNNISEGIAEMPHAFMCFGAIYYTILTFVDVILIRQRVKKDNTK